MFNITDIRAAVLPIGRLPRTRPDVDHTSRPLVFRLVPPDWTEVWEAVDSLRLRADELEHPGRELAYALVQVCMSRLREMWEAQAQELTDADPRCVMERSAFVLASESVVDEKGRWTDTDEGALIARYADSSSCDEPTWLSRAALCDLASRIEMETALR